MIWKYHLDIFTMNLSYVHGWVVKAIGQLPVTVEGGGSDKSVAEDIDFVFFSLCKWKPLNFVCAIYHLLLKQGLWGAHSSWVMWNK